MRRKSIKRGGFGGISDSAKNIGILISIATVLVVAILGGGSLYKNSKMKKMRKSILESAARGGDFLDADAREEQDAIYAEIARKGADERIKKIRTLDFDREQIATPEISRYAGPTPYTYTPEERREFREQRIAAAEAKETAANRAAYSAAAAAAAGRVVKKKEEAKEAYLREKAGEVKKGKRFGAFLSAAKDKAAQEQAAEKAELKRSDETMDAFVKEAERREKLQEYFDARAKVPPAPPTGP